MRVAEIKPSNKFKSSKSATSSFKKSAPNSFISDHIEVDPVQKEKIKQEMRELYKDQIGTAFPSNNQSLKIEDLDFSKISFTK
jgi:hypothetical protein